MPLILTLNLYFCKQMKISVTFLRKFKYYLIYDYCIPKDKNKIGYVAELHGHFTKLLHTDMQYKGGTYEHLFVLRL